MKPRDSLREIAEACADDWGGREDPHRDDYLRGFFECVERKGKQGAATPPPIDTDMAANAAYSSGWIAAREEFAL